MEAKGTVAVARAIGRFSPELEPYVLKDVAEERKETDDFRCGSDAVVIDLDLQGTKCVGKQLHPIFFEAGNTRSGMEKILEKFFKEIKMLSKMSHPNIVKFLGIYYKEDPSLSMELPVLVMEKMEFSLTQYLSSHEKGSIPEEHTLNILLDVSKGLVYLHEEMKVAHRDLCSNNILLAADMSAKIADLGSARVLDRPGGWASHAQLTAQPGTMDFMPPETLEDPPKYTVSVDVFSFGCVIIHLCTHKWPKPIGKTAQGKIISEFKRREKYISEMSDSNLLPIVRRCLEESSTNRPASTDVMSLLHKKAEEVSLNNTEQAQYTIVFAGITGAGKSTAGNLFLNEKAFSSKGGVLRGSKVSLASTATICGKTVKIIDTPGFFDGFKSTEENFNELSEVLTLAKNGIHAVAFVMGGRYTTSCEEAVKQLLLFKGVQPFVFVLLTHVENDGINKATTEKYIKECLSSPDCPPGFRNLMDMVENRVIMLESVAFVADNYREQKRQELMAMVEHVFKINESRIYTNVLLQHTAEVYKKAKLQQETEMQKTTQSLALNTEKIKQLKKQQMDNTTITVNSKNITDEVAALEKENKILEIKLEKIKDKKYLEQVTNNILKDEMIKSNIKTNSIAKFVAGFAFLVIGTTFTIPSIVIGENIGRFAGSVIPRMGTEAGLKTGANVGFIVGGIFACQVSSRATEKIYDSCKTQ